MQDNYGLRYLPLFKQELDLAVTYIAFQLNDIDAANSLLDNVEIAIKNRLNNPESFEPVPSKKDRKHPYYRIYVDNYIVYYVVLEENGQKIMEVRRLLHTLQDRDNKI
ncbi:type II toxin-antitoxin system RelE/ParE family toxin [Pseudobutyrivibrio xylanivorans]|uniref:ParE toxin of type II toxin-antitoxin system, parDE n=1 Tax=Pseudobutyrivibrio xylanivorans TaxID=185007 RepID=A0A1G5S1A8_PSEXY|nr:type II toxin-antitoxin system RelE/ParE family toxin [Pseudobutyrivibrio xylanivorans]SCZ79928.1 ParE toxin of type II toxin-antitoxin system, parDE [Pseudobutyrivibrio xylanivorans]